MLLLLLLWLLSFLLLRLVLLLSPLRDAEREDTIPERSSLFLLLSAFLSFLSPLVIDEEEWRLRAGTSSDSDSLTVYVRVTFVRGIITECARAEKDAATAGLTTNVKYASVEVDTFCAVDKAEVRSGAEEGDHCW